MPDPGFTQSDPCSIHGAAKPAKFAGADRGLPSSDDYPVADHDRPAASADAFAPSPGIRRYVAGDRPPRLTVTDRAITEIAGTGKDNRATSTGSIDRAICLSMAAAVLAVAGVAAYVSYCHTYAIVRGHGETGVTARLEPATIDGLIYAGSMVILYAARHGYFTPRVARCLLGLGITVTLTTNMAQGWAHGP
jgi:hypothetical protein